MSREFVTGNIYRFKKTTAIGFAGFRVRGKKCDIVF